jgi:hypothetical protein
MSAPRWVWVDHDGRVMREGTRERCEVARAGYEAACRLKGIVPAVTDVRAKA